MAPYTAPSLPRALACSDIYIYIYIMLSVFSSALIYLRGSCLYKLMEMKSHLLKSDRSDKVGRRVARWAGDNQQHWVDWLVLHIEAN
jgi:hypothetical protein